MSTPVRLGIAGLGAVAQAVYLPLLARRHDLFEVTAICDLAPDQLAGIGGRIGVPEERRFADLTSMLDSGAVDAVVLLTSGSHGDAAADAVTRGIPVLCEKPLAYTQSEVDKLDAVLAEGKAGLLLGYMKQYDPAVRRAADLVAAAGPVRSVDVTVLHPSGESQLDFARVGGAPVAPSALAGLLARDRELTDAALGTGAPDELRRLYSGVVLGSLIHDLSVLRSLGQTIETVEHVRVWDAGAEPGSVEVIGELGGGGRYAMHWHYLPDYPAYRETVAVHHGTGSVELVFPSPYLLNAPTTLTAVEGGPTECRAEYRSVVEAFEQQLVAFHAMVTRGEEPLAGTEQGRADIVTCQRIVRRYAHQSGITIEGEAATA